MPRPDAAARSESPSNGMGVQVGVSAEVGEKDGVGVAVEVGEGLAVGVGRGWAAETWALHETSAAASRISPRRRRVLG